MTKHRQILNLISNLRDSHPLMTDIFMEGSCYNLHLILKTIYPEAQLIYTDDHVMTSIDGRCYDIRGCVKCKGHSILRVYSKRRSSRAIKQMMSHHFK